MRYFKCFQALSPFLLFFLFFPLLNWRTYFVIHSTWDLLLTAPNAKEVVVSDQQIYVCLTCSNFMSFWLVLFCFFPDKCYQVQKQSVLIAKQMILLECFLEMYSLCSLILLKRHILSLNIYILIRILHFCREHCPLEYTCQRCTLIYFMHSLKGEMQQSK